MYFLSYTPTVLFPGENFYVSDRKKTRSHSNPGRVALASIGQSDRETSQLDQRTQDEGP